VTSRSVVVLGSFAKYTELVQTADGPQHDEPQTECYGARANDGDFRPRVDLDQRYLPAVAIVYQWAKIALDVRQELAMDRNSRDGGKSGFFSSRANIVLIGFLAIAAFYLIAEHRAHVIPFVPWLLLLACPLLHLFMHGGHGGHGGGDSGSGSANDRQNQPHRH